MIPYLIKQLVIISAERIDILSMFFLPEKDIENGRFVSYKKNKSFFF